MRLPARRVSAPTVLVLSLALPIASAAGIHLQPRQQPTAPCHRGRQDGAGHVLPLLRWLRDSAAEVVFGRPTNRAPSSTYVPEAAQEGRYLNDVVVRFNVTDRAEETALARAAEQVHLDIWAFTPEYVDLRVEKSLMPALLKLLPRSLESVVLIPNVAEAVMSTFPTSAAPSLGLVQSRFGPRNNDRTKLRASADDITNIFFQEYQPLSVISSWARLLEALFPSLTEIITIGKSYERRDILGVRVGARPAEGSQGPRKTILVTGGLHGREWISTSTTNYLLWSVITAYDKEPLVTKLLQHFDFVFVPVLNPDGYEYTWQHDRLWRKSRQETETSFCRGMDLDHAFGYAWESTQHQNDPCSESYGGDKPFQAVEASELAKWAKNETENGAKFVGFLDLHSYSQQIMYPYSYTCSVDPPNRENLEELAFGLAKAIRISGGESYTVTSACEGAVVRVDASDSFARVESGAGSAIDWFYHELQARYSYQIKLGDTGSYGFLLPKERIIPTGDEMLNALKYFGDFLLGNNGIEKPFFQQQQDAWSDLRRRRR